jgi:hypothetical protein
MTQNFNAPKIHPSLLNFVRPSAHSTFSPSAADAWLACHYRKNAIVDIPEETSIYAEQGTLAHTVCEATFRQEFFGLPFPAELNLELAQWEAKNPGDVDEMFECAKGYVEVLHFWLNNKNDIGDVICYNLEKGIPIFPEEGCFGTGDCIIIGTKGAAVIDYKHGKGKNVSANSLQLKVYAAGIARHLENIPEGYLFHAVVYQPRTDPGAKHTNYNVAEMNQFLGQIWSAIQGAKASNLSPVEGNHCYWCPARKTKDLALKCSAIKEKPLKLAQENFAKFINDMNAPVKSLAEVNPKRDEAILKIMALYPLMKEVVQNGEEEFMMRLQAGEVIPGVRVVDVMGKRQYNADGDEQIIELIKSKFPTVVPTKVIPSTTKVRTISEIEKEIGKNKLDSICIKKVTKKIDILDEKMRSILGEMATYGSMINNGDGHKE